jgi:hypothetical protein
MGGDTSEWVSVRAVADLAAARDITTTLRKVLCVEVRLPEHFTHG